MKKNNACIGPKQVGVLGENIARDFLTSRGYKILEKNLKTPFGEIDIIARKRQFTVFFEVKTRMSEEYGTPLSSITDIKKEQYITSLRMSRPEIFRLDAQEVQTVIKTAVDRREHIHLWNSETFKDFLNNSFRVLNIRAKTVFESTGEKNSYEYFAVWEKL